MAASESQEQVALMDWLRLQYPDVAKHTIYIINEQKCSLNKGKKLNALGRLAGASDLFIAKPNNLHAGLFLEMKSLTGKCTKKQIEFLERMNKAGYLALKANGADEAINIVKNYLTDKL